MYGIYIYTSFLSLFLCANNQYLCLLFNQLFCVDSTAFAQVAHLVGKKWYAMVVVFLLSDEMQVIHAKWIFIF